MQFFNLLAPYKVVLASKSPRRQQLLSGLGVSFEIRTKEVDESFPAHFEAAEVVRFLAEHKAEAFKEEMQANELVITSDTTVSVNDTILNKPENRAEAISMLTLLSGKTHTVATGVCLMTQQRTHTFVEQTQVTFDVLTQEEIEYYIDNFKPYDKAGSYGVQDFIGYMGVKKLDGCFFNVMGLPLNRLYHELQTFLQQA